MQILHGNQGVLSLTGGSTASEWNLSGLRFGLGRSTRAPRISVDVCETIDDVLVSADIPGATDEDVSLHVRGNTITLSGVIKPDADAEKKIFRFERASGTFSRHVTLPSAVDENSIETLLQNGVLCIRLKKRL